MVRGIHELIRGHNFRVLVEIPENLKNSKMERYTVHKFRDGFAHSSLGSFNLQKMISDAYLMLDI